MLTLKWEILNTSGADGHVACGPAGTCRCSSNYIIRERQTPTSNLCYLLGLVGGWNLSLLQLEPSISAAACIYIVICLPPRTWLEPHGEPSARRSGGAVFTLALEIHHRPPCDPGSKRRWDKTACQSLLWINCGIFEDCVGRSLMLFSLVGIQSPLMIFAQWLKASAVFPSTKKKKVATVVHLCRQIKPQIWQGN